MSSNTSSNKKSGGRAVDRSPVLEVQYHPSDIRRPVRYFFIDKRQYWLFGGLAVAWTMLVLFGLRAAPSVIADQLAKSRFEAETQERARQGARLKDLVERMSLLKDSTEDVQTELSRLYLVYGFSVDESMGQGGYPLAPAKGTQSIYADSIRKGNGLNASINERFGVIKSFLSEVQAFEENHEDLVRTTPSLMPVVGDDFVLTSPFGNRTSPFTQRIDFHAGIDLAAAEGTPIVAPADGVVAFAGRFPLRQNVGWYRYGNMVAIRHADHFITLYGHCDEVTVRNGQRVAQGDLIATVGDTGMSTNAHLHYEIRRLGDDGKFTPVDPRIYILDHRWRDAERLLIRARQAPDASDYEPLPRPFER